jgi:hypothetical protein
MKTPLKKLFFWSSLGSVLLGATIAVARKRPGHKSNFPCQRIPPSCRRIDIWTELTEASENDNRVLWREHYVLRLTAFKVWSILELPVSPGRPNPTGAMVYHVTYSRLVESPGGSGSGESAITALFPSCRPTETSAERTRWRAGRSWRSGNAMSAVPAMESKQERFIDPPPLF